MPSTQATTPQLAVPFTLTPDGREALVEQGTGEELRQHAEVAARVLRGSLDADPAFGTSDQVGREGGIDRARLAAELVECDPRFPEVEIDQEMDGMTAIVTARIQGGQGA